MAYADSDDLIARYDEQTLKDLASDTGDPVADISTDTAVTAALNDASGRVQSAVSVSRLYSATELAALTGSSLALLKRITCELAMVFMLERRPEKYGDEYTRRLRQSSEDYLERLRKGERLFDVEVAKDAGLPSIDGPTTVDARNLNLITTRTQNFYPSKASRLPLGRGG